MSKNFKLADGKYEVILNEFGTIDGVLRHGKPWPEGDHMFKHAGFVLALVQALDGEIDNAEHYRLEYEHAQNRLADEQLSHNATGLQLYLLRMKDNIQGSRLFSMNMLNKQITLIATVIGLLPKHHIETLVDLLPTLNKCSVQQLDQTAMWLWDAFNDQRGITYHVQKPDSLNQFVK